jgi:hypothetical protein
MPRYCQRPARKLTAMNVRGSISVGAPLVRPDGSFRDGNPSLIGQDLTVAMFEIFARKRTLVAKLSRMLSRSLPRDKVKELS